MQTKYDTQIKPIEYLGGVMDEETRPLLKSYIDQLEEGEAALVVFRLLEGDSPDALLESTIDQIAGHGWDFVSGGEGEGPMQDLVNNLSKEASELRVANNIFSQGGAKIKAFDNHKVCFGLITKNGEPIQSIKGIVHQQLNMGLNGDLLMHEGDVIMQSLIDNNVFKQEGRDRPLLVTTYGAGGSSSHEVNPGIMAISDGVIDIRTHVDPKCIMEYLQKFCVNLEETSGLDKTSEEGRAFYKKLQEIEHNIEDEPGYSGIAMVHDIAELARNAAAYTGQSTKDIMGGMDPSEKRYYGEITFGNPSSGVSTMHRINVDENGKPFVGNDGQSNLLKSLQHFIAQMSELSEKEEEHHENVRRLTTTLHQMERNASQIADKINHLLVNNLSEEEIIQLTLIKDEIERLDKAIQERSNFILNHLGHDVEVYEELTKMIKQDEAEIQSLIEMQNIIYDGVSQQLHGRDLQTYHNLREDLDEVNEQIPELSAGVGNMIRHHMELIAADTKLKQAINLAKATHQLHFARETPFSITASGNIFFTEDDKKAVGKYGAKLVEMENQLFVEIIHHSIANKVYVDKEFITKIAADPLKIDNEVTQKLNEWAATHSMTVQDYVDAFMWAKNGQSFEHFPESGRWTVAEELFKQEEKDFAKLFYNFGTEVEPKIVNPFWKEIGTDLVKEIKEGKAFQGTAFNEMDFNTSPLKDRKQDLVNQATFIIANPDDEEIEAKVRNLFTEYLELMPGMKLDKEENQEQRYRVYARSIPVLKKGYVQDAVSDWDQPLYKSSNTALLDKEASKFLALERGKHIGGGKAMMLHDEPGIKLIESPNAVLYKMMKAEKSKNYQEAYKIGKEYLEQDPKAMFGSKCVATVNYIERIERMVKSHQPRIKPPFPAEIGIRENKVTGPRVAEALREMSKENPQQALKSAERFLAWKNYHHRNLNVQDIKKLITELTKPKEVLHSYKNMQGGLTFFRKSDKEPEKQEKQENQLNKSIN
ncbi:hypothetical protein [Legionella longbeachae]|nr:hypothetical protein [Legionella longbeachae]HBD7397226.1 hypothetical protein [Legionella pneumophila]ARB93151.2 hypothetical protein A6J40_13650 [Legionella longbeachae]ARM33785.2 hypothetical protein B0B39_09690 [Legionella longbeachae]QIN33650.1 hypothetical protein GCB94_16585 [Legionella longbeachae]QIN37003.1 hypothetical protein GCS73_15865 [Legionella longbeachae]